MSKWLVGSSSSSRLLSDSSSRAMAALDRWPPLRESHRLLKGRLVKAQPQQGGPHPAAVIQPALGGEALLEPVLALDQSGIPGPLALQQDVDLLQLPFRLLERGKDAFHLVPESTVGVAQTCCSI